jgi:hypothetical protein
MQNEDSFFFWTFSEKNIPDVQLRLLEKLFGDWLVKKYGSLEAALTKWNGLKVKRDARAEGRIGFRPLWNMFNEKTARDQDTAQFLLEVQTRFYSETYAFLRKLGFKGPITASNWATASPEVFGPLEKLSYTCGDFIDRHGYVGCNHKGENAAWSLRNGHTYTERSALRFDAEQPGKPRQFVHPAMDVHYGGKPTMISETTWERPNRFRSEAPLYLAAYGALQRRDCALCPRQPRLGGEAELLDAAVDADDTGDDGAVSSSGAHLSARAGDHGQRAGRPPSEPGGPAPPGRHAAAPGCGAG